MPVVHLRALPQPAGVDVTAAARRLCVELARITGGAPKSFWATWETLEPGRYVEGDTPATVQPRDTHPPLVEIVAFEGRDEAEIERILRAVADVLCDALGLEPGNVFATYTEARSGRVFSGGAVRRR